MQIEKTKVSLHLLCVSPSLPAKAASRSLHLSFHVTYLGIMQPNAYFPGGPGKWMFMFIKLL